MKICIHRHAMLRHTVFTVWNSTQLINAIQENLPGGDSNGSGT